MISLMGKFYRNYLAAAIDVLSVGIVRIVIRSLLVLVVGFVNKELAHNIENYIVGNYELIVGLILISLNAMWQEIVFGTTLGKHILGLAVRSEDGKKASKKQIIIRNLVYPIDTVFAVGGLPLLSSKGRSLGDCISKTKLID